MTELEDMVTAALDEMSSLSPGLEIGAGHTRQGILEALVSALSLPQRALRFHTIKMLNHVQGSKCEIFPANCERQV